MNQANAQVEVQRDRCPFCHDAVRPEQDKTACDACMAWHHKDCWADHGGCSACGEGASTEVKPSPKEAPVAVQRAVRAIQPPATEAPQQTGAQRTWMSKAGFLISLATALFGFALLSMSYSSQETTEGIWLFKTTTPKGFSGLGVGLTLLLTGPLLVLGAGFSFGGRHGDRTLAKAGLIVSGVYGLALLVSSVMAFS